MKTNATKTIVLLITLCTAFFAKAQLNYQPGGFSTNVGTYTDLGLTGDTIAVANYDDAFSAALPIGFTLNFNGHPYDSFVFSTNGFIKLGRDSASRHFLFTGFVQPPPNGPFTAGTTPTPLASDTSILFAFGQDLYGGTSQPEYRYFTDGSPGSRVCTIQWKNVKDKLQAGTGGAYDTINFQIKLYEGTNVVEYVYGSWTTTIVLNFARFSAVGIVGNSFSTLNQQLHLVKGSTVAWGAAVANTGFYLNNAINYRNPISTPAGPSPELGRTYRFTPLTLNDASVRAVYAQGRIALPFYRADPIVANIYNPGINALTGVTVTLDITGANSYTTTAFIASLASGANTNVSFTPFMPTATGSGLISISVPSDDNNANNVLNYSYSVSNTEMGYRDTLIPHTGSNGTTIPNFWGAKYFVAGTGMVTKVKSFLVANSDAVGDTVCGMVLDTLGKIVGRSPSYVVQPSDLGTFMSFTMTLPVTVTNQSVIAGIAGSQSVNGINYFLGTSQTEVPIRPDPAFYFLTQAAPGGLTGAVIGATYATIFTPSWTTTRLMQECTVEPLPDNDVGIVGSGPLSKIKIPVNVSVPLKATIRNNGLVAQSAGLEVRYSVNGGPVIGPVLSGAGVNSFDTISVVFTGADALNFASAGTYTLKIYTSMAGDGIIGNDTFTVTYVAQPANTLPYRISNNILGTWAVENSTPALWMQGSAVQANDVFNGNVLFANNISVNNRTATIFSPTFDFTGISNPVMHFNVAHAPNTFPNTDDTLEVLVSIDGGYTYTSTYMRTSQLSSPTLGTEPATSSTYTPLGASGWRHETANLGAAAGQPFVVIAFRDKSASGNRIYIGNISVTGATSINVLPVPGPSTYINDNIFLTFSSVGATTGELNFAKYTTPSASTASPVFDTNTVASTSNGAIFQADQACNTQWYSITYSGIGTGNPASSAQYTISFDITGIPGIPVPDSVYIMRRANFDAPWRPVSTTVSGSIISSGLLTGFSDFSIGSISASNPLPVNWLSFTGKGLNKFENYLQWSTASEVNNDYFVVERSADMMNFTAVQKVKSQGNSSKTQVYSIVDKLKESSSRNMYYRIKQVDADGKHTYSKVVTIKPFVQSSIDVTISNPFEGAPVIYFDNSIKASMLSIEVTDITGKVVLTQSYTLAEGRNEFTPLEFSGLRNGVYFTQIKIDDMQLNTKKLLKAK
jgi:hypothetical protein